LLPWTRIVVLAVEVFFVLFSTLNGQDNKDKALELNRSVPGVSPDSRTAIYSVDLNESTREKPQQLLLTALVPGKTNQVNVRVKNGYSELLTIEKLTVSCGCMVVKQFNSALAVGAESDLELEIKVGSGSGTEQREVRFDAANGKVWSVRIACQPVKVFVASSQAFDVGMEDTDEVRIFKIDFDESAIASGLVGGINESVTCVGGGAMARDVKITRNEFGVEIAVTPEWSSFGLKKKVSEILQIEHPNFRSAVSVDFRNKSVVRISPTSCSDVRLISGGQRFVLIKDQWIG